MRNRNCPCLDEPRCLLYLSLEYGGRIASFVPNRDQTSLREQDAMQLRTLGIKPGHVT